MPNAQSTLALTGKITRGESSSSATPQAWIGPGPAERQQCDAAKILALLDGVHARGSGHVLVDELVDAGSGLVGRKAEDIGHRVQRRIVGGEVELHVAAQEVAGIEQAEGQVGVGHRGLATAAAVARGSGVGAGGLRSDLQQAELVDARQAAAPGADLDEVDRGHRDGEPRALLEPVDAGHLERVGDLRFAVR